MVRTASGFSLVEALVAMTIFGLVILGVVGGFSMVQDTFTQAARRDAAIAVVRRQLALVTLQPAASHGTEGPLEWAVTIVEAEHHLAVATVTVNWKDKGKSRQLKVSQVVQQRRGDSGSARMICLEPLAQSIACAQVVES
jgi:type II secretory pathway pseudopilin PulG